MRKTKAAVLSVVSGLIGLAAHPAFAAWELNMPEGVTPVSQDIYWLHMAIMIICAIIGVGVFGTIFYSIFKHRKSKGAKAASFHESQTVEVVWTVIPFLILVGMAIPAADVLIDMEDTRNADMTLKITGYQWMWEYEYVEEGVSFYSRLDDKSNRARARNSGLDPRSVDNYLLNVDKAVVLPVDTKVRILMTSNDVIHAWWVPDLGVKKDAIPGFINETWTKITEPGVYRGQCAELCGKDHGFMPIVVKAVPKAEYQQWLAEQKGGEDASARTASL